MYEVCIAGVLLLVVAFYEGFKDQQRDMQRERQDHGME